MLTEIEPCWTRIGVFGGDQSCPELAQVVHCRHCPVYARAGRALLEQEPPEGYLAHWAAQLATAHEREDAETLSTVVFRLAAERLALPTTACVEVVEPRPVHRIPHRAGTVLRGVANIRGELLLVVSLTALLGIAPDAAAAAGRSRLLVIEHDGERWVFAVDELLGVHRVARAALAPPPATVAHDDRAATTALFDLGEVRVALLDDALLCGRLRRAVA